MQTTVLNRVTKKIKRSQSYNCLLYRYFMNGIFHFWVLKCYKSVIVYF